jgi:hypothetical protein
MAEFTSDFLASIGNMMDSKMLDINTSIDGVIVSYDAGLATVQPIGQKRFADGDVLDFPPIRRVPVRWPSFNGGQAGFKGPVTPGDKCQLIFSQQASDGSDDMRRFDLSDAYAIIASNETVQGGGNNDDCIMWFGGAYIKITPAGAVEINAPAGMKVIAPTNEFTGAVLIRGMLTFMGGITGSALSGAAAVITGAINFIGTLTSNGKNISDSHIHTNSGGTGNGGPVA